MGRANPRKVTAMRSRKPRHLLPICRTCRAQAHPQAGYAPQPQPAPQPAHGFTAPQASYVPHDQTAYYDDHNGVQDDDDQDGLPRLGFAQWAGATVSLALVVMIGVWGYKQMVRDVSGVPVIRALEGEARVIPDDPGGQLAVHQGLAVNSVTADGSAAAPADSLVLAPREIALSDEDKPMGELAPATLTAVDDTQASNPYAENLAQIEPVSARIDPDAEELDASEEDPVDVAALEKGAGFPSPIPKPRPLRMAFVNPTTSLDGVAGDILAAVGAASEIDPADVPAGSAAVQLGAFAQQEAARLKWETLSDQFGEFMAGKQRMIVEASAGGKPFYRLRAVGFEGTEDSNRFCAALEALNASCVPVIVE